jgi:hypothetical protein
MNRQDSVQRCHAFALVDLFCIGRPLVIEDTVRYARFGFRHEIIVQGHFELTCRLQ